MLSHVRPIVFFALCLGLWVTGVQPIDVAFGAAPSDSLLPNVSAQKGPEAHWTLARTADARSVGVVDAQTQREPGTPSLHIRSEGDTGYAEWRVSPNLALTPGETYRFSVWVKNRSSRPPHFEAYSFDEEKKPRLFSGAKGQPGHSDWYPMHANFKVPEDSKEVRIGFGLSRSDGEVWFSEPTLTSASAAEGAPSAGRPAAPAPAPPAAAADTAEAATQPGGLLPDVTAQKGPEPHWALARTADARASAAVDTQVQRQAGTPTLHLRKESDEGYAEWRVSPNLTLTPGEAYRFSVWVKNRSSRAPHLEAYSFDADKKPRRFGDAYGQAGNSDWYPMSVTLKVPEDSKGVRLGIGLARSDGEVWFSEPMLTVASASTAASGAAGRAAGEPAAIAAASPPAAASPSLLTWEASWIWVRDDPGVPEVEFQKTVHFETRPAAMIVQLTADNGYHFVVNGHDVGGDTDWRSIERYDITEYLRAGDNDLRVTVANYDGAGGLLLQGVAFDAAGRQRVIVSDESWSVAAASLPNTALEVLGGPPVEPWGAVALANFNPPQIMALAGLEASTDLGAGDVFRVVFKPSQPLPEEEVARLSCRFYEEGVERSLTGYSPHVAVRDDGSVLVELPISPYAAPGDYHWRLEGVRYRFVPESGNDRFVVRPNAAAAAIPAPTPWGDPGNVHHTAGGPQAPFTYSTTSPSVERFVNWQSTGGHMYEVTAPMSGLWKGAGRWDLAPVERQLLQILEADPLASVYIKIRYDMPGWWLSAHPDDRYRSNGGKVALQSFASDAWRRDAVAGTVELINALRERPAGACIVGVLPMGFRGGEFQLWGEEVGEYDVSPVALRAFAAWQAAQGIPEAERMTLPHPALAMPFEPGAENARARQLFFRFVAERHGENLVHLTRGIKDAFGGDISVALYFGYVLEHSANINRLLFGGHLGIDRVIREAPIDMLGSPASYAHRGPGKPFAFMYPAGSAALHGILPLIEDDVRNYLTPFPSDSSGRSLPGITETFTSMRKLRLLAATQGAAVRHLALIDTVDFFQAPPVLAEIARLNRLVVTLQPAEVGQAGQVAVLLDPLAYTAAADLPDAREMVRTFLMRTPDTLARTGRSITYVLMDDWAERPQLWDTVVVPLPSLLSQERLSQLEAAFGTVPSIATEDGLLILSRTAQPATVTELPAAWQLLASPAAREAGRDAIWYTGGNFTARYQDGRIDLLPGPADRATSPAPRPHP